MNKLTKTKNLAFTLVLLSVLAACVEKVTKTNTDLSAVASTKQNQIIENSVANSTSAPGTINPGTWSLQKPVMIRDAGVEKKIVELLNKMTLEEKVGQVVQADIASVTPEEVKSYNLGSILNGGASAPGGDNRATPDKWLALADEFWKASTDTSDGGVGIPALWGTDAVHGHSNILGATLFPHNIGLGMANNPEMMVEIGKATALEMRVTGLDWTFAPTIAVVRNDRWGRTYESYSEDPKIVTDYAPKIVEGLQGKIGSPDFLSNKHLIATAKHFAGDGGTVDGKDQGNNVSAEEEFRNQQAAAYPAAIAAGVQSVMASYNTYHGRKMHGHKEMLTDVLVGRMGFDGFVVGDWNGHGQVKGCTNTSCAQSFNAGLDMFMAPDSWKGIYKSLLKQVKSGDVSTDRLDQAVSRVLRVKMRAGLFDAGLPSQRPYAGEYELLSSPNHKAVARKAVRKSLVLLKNQNQTLPIQQGTKVLMAGDGAHNIGKQSGGWTLNWQGTDNLREHFPNGTSIYEGFVNALGESNVELSVNGDYSDKPDLAVVVFGEDPYAEFQGDLESVDYASDDGLNLLKKFKSQGIPTVALFISGRPMFMNPEINASDAFVAVWLPGSEGGGIADVLVANDSGKAAYDFAGRLSFSWPKLATQTEVNLGDEDYAPLFAYGYGLSYSDKGDLAVLSEDSGLSADAKSTKGDLIKFGDPMGDWGLILRDSHGDTRIGDARGSSAGDQLSIAPVDYKAQEDTLVATWQGNASLLIQGREQDFLREANGGLTVQIEYRVLSAPKGKVSLRLIDSSTAEAQIDVTDAMRARAGKDWQVSQIPLSCFKGVDMAKLTSPFMISSTDGFDLQITSAIITAPVSGDGPCEL